MSYLLLIVEAPDQRRATLPAEGRGRYERMVAYSNKLKANGMLLATESLRSHAVRLVSRDGRTSTTDGPFAEAKEFVGGFFLLNCTTRQEALAAAAGCPAAEWATVEVRETGPCYD